MASAAKAGFLALALPSLLAGQDGPYRALKDPARFLPYGDTYVIWHQMKNNAWAGTDEGAFRAHYSLRYDLYESGTKQWNFFFTYTGEFDFYMGTRPSGPVVNRISNPGLHLRYTPKDGPLDYWEAGVEHRSDGQVTEVTSPRDQELARVAYLRKDRPFFDQISRGSNFVSVAAKLSSDSSANPFILYVKGRIYFSQDTDVTWGPLADQKPRISDYDRLTLRAITKDFTVGGLRLGQFELQSTLGDKLSHSSHEFAWQFPRIEKHWYFPLYIRYHSGPLNTLSNYTQRQNSWGIGLRFQWIGANEERHPERTKGFKK
ncbi:MAG: hypothetical protein U0P81_02775 [Holophagaceae bacterium]